jgi:hypothetical protein
VRRYRLTTHKSKYKRASGAPFDSRRSPMSVEHFAAIA